MIANKRFFNWNQIQITVILVTTLGASPKEEPNVSQMVELRQKINEYKEKSITISEKIASTKSESTTDLQDAERYRKSYASEFARLQKEHAELSEEKMNLSHSSDSLARSISMTQNKTRELELRQRSFNSSLAETILLYSSALREFPAPLLTKEKESLIFLHKEVSSNTISSIEGIERLWEVIKSINKERLTIDVWQAISAWENITGQVHYLRIGYSWLGMVNENGTVGALWNGSEWKALTNPSQVTNLRTAVNVRTGNAIPALVQIPLFQSSKATAK